MNVMDVYGYQQEPDGSWIVTKNGDFFLSVSGGKEEAMKIAKVLNEDENASREAGRA